MYTRFKDSASPNSITDHSLAGAYWNGPSAWSQSQANRMGGVITIGVHSRSYLGNSAFDTQAKNCRVLDIETGDAYIQDAVPFIQARMSYGHHDATIYCQASTWGSIWNLVKRTPGLHYRFWIAWYGSTNTDRPWLLAPQWAPGAPQPWARQFHQGPNGGYDLNLLYGVNDFAPPTSTNFPN